MAATLITARFDMLTKAEYEAARVAAEDLRRRREPNNPSGDVSHYDNRAAYDLEIEMGRLMYQTDPAAREAARVALVTKYAEKLPGLEITIGEPCQVGRVLSYEGWTERVMSDVWDTVYYAKVWDGEKVVTTGDSGCVVWNYDGGSVYLEGLDQNGLQSDYANPGPGTGYRCKVIWQPDADEATKEAAAAWEAEAARVAAHKDAGRRFMDTVEQMTRAALTPRQISYARVVKGRKAPRGSGYQITYVNHHGQYGPYAHLLAKDGKKYQYISLDNLEAEPVWEEEFTTLVAPYTDGPDATLNALVRKMAADGDPTRWLIIADRIEELVSPEMAGEIRHVATRRMKS